MNASGAGPIVDRPSPVVLRLLPHLHPPPARVLVATAGSGHEARALDARGYDVVVVDAGEVPGGIPVLAAHFVATDFAGGFDLVCEHGGMDTADRRAWVAAAARALRPGGQLFGSFAPGDVSALLHLLAPAFDVIRCQPGGFSDGRLELVAVRR
ncbi:MAG: hypothetical protein FJ102_18980 [Deltaproteobacteria bacterium]|nr:hypothetical protein [Deltaproteobacteria bacterium]